MPRIRCGSCRGVHSSVEEVRSCSAFIPNWRLSAPSSRRLSLAHAVARERECPEQYVSMEGKALHEAIDKMSAGECSEFIRLMLKQPYIEKTSFGDFPEIKPGKYALMDGDDVKFYQVSKVIREGAPRILYGLYGAPGEFRKHRIYRADNIMARIAADPNAAFALFGQRVGQCGVCSSPLTQQHTRERGVGDICWGKLQI